MPHYWFTSVLGDDTRPRLPLRLSTKTTLLVALGSRWRTVAALALRFGRTVCCWANSGR